MVDFDFATYQQRISSAIVASCQMSPSFAALGVELHRLAAAAEHELVQRPQGDRNLIACGPGCGSCCVVNVACLLPEGVTIAHYLQAFEKAQREEIIAKLEGLWCEIRGLDDEERLFVRRSCAFLDDQGCCRIYPVRPLLCRSITSTDADNCREVLNSAVFGAERPILMHQLQQQLYETVFTGVADGLQRLGIDGRSFQISGLVRYLVRQPEAEAQLLDGHRLCWQDLY